MARKIRVGVIGAGRMASWHVKGFHKIDTAEIVGIAGRSAENVGQLRKKFRIPKGYTDYRKLLDELKPDAVAITTPTATHCQLAIDSLAAGAHVLCEKPLAMTLAEADRMIEAEQAHRRILMPGFSQRYFKEFIRMKQIIDRGELGPIRVAWFRRGIGLPPQPWYADSTQSPGVNFELAIHAIDWLRWIIPEPVTRVSAEMTRAEAGIDDNIWILIVFSSGALGVVGASYAFPFLKRDIGVIGEKKVLTVERCKVVTEGFSSHSLARMFVKFVLYSCIVPYWLYYNPFERQARDFIACIVKGTAPPITSTDGRESLAIACAAYESARSGVKMQLS